MGQKKLERFEAIRQFPNVVEYTDEQELRGNWNNFFGNEQPLTLELACGKGEYALGLGRLYPQKNFLGIDIKGNRIWKGAKTALEEGLKNVAFLRTQIDQLEKHFAPGDVSEIWITFPDPQLRFSKMKKRLTWPRFLRIYSRIMQPNGIIHLKTDSPDLYQFTKAVINLYDLTLLADTDNLYTSEFFTGELQIKTHYEGLDIAQSNRIHYLKFRLDQPTGEDKEELLKTMFRDATAG